VIVRRSRARIAALLAAAFLAVGASACSSAGSAGSSNSAAATLHDAVKATLAASSFSQQGYLGEGSDCAVKGDGEILHAVYQAPDRFESAYEDLGTDIAVGNITYTKDDGSAKWIAQDLVGQTARQQEAKWLSPLLANSTIERTDGSYVSEVDPVLMSLNNDSYVTFKGRITTYIKGGRVASEHIAGTVTNHGGGLSLPTPECGVLTYDRYGASPAIALPPAQDVIECTPGKVISLSRTDFIQCPSQDPTT
jgi:hypothetical protein